MPRSILALLLIWSAATLSLKYQTFGADVCEWDYKNTDWAVVCPGLTTCDGSSQSPIDIRGAKYNNNLTPLQHSFIELKDAEAEYNGHAIQVNPSVDAGTTTGGDSTTVFYLRQLHFHAKSEHRIEGRQTAMEMHLVHFSNETVGVEELMVTTVLFDISSEENTALKPLFDALSIIKENNRTTIDMDLMAALPTDESYYNYQGSLTTPPCTEGLTWYVYKQVQNISQKQFDEFFAFVSPRGNFRPVQSINGRVPVNLYTPDVPEPHQLTVVDGSSRSTQYLQGTLVDVYAIVNETLLFDRWTGSEEDMKILTNTTDYHVQFVMPDHDVTLTATFREPLLESSLFEKQIIEERAVYYYLPPKTVCVLFWFHDNDEKASDYDPGVTRSQSYKSFVLSVTNDNIGMVLLDSGDGIWQPHDEDYVNGVLNYLMNERVLRNQDVRIAGGFGAGANFAFTVANEFDFEAMISVAADAKGIELDPPLPTKFVLLENDRTTSAQVAYDQVSFLRDQKEFQTSYSPDDASVAVIFPSPMVASLFQRIGADMNMSVEIAQVFDDAKLLNDDGYFLFSPETNLSAWEDSVKPDFVPGARYIASTLWTSHRFNDDITGHVVSFCLKHQTTNTAVAWYWWALVSILALAFVICTIIYVVVRYTTKQDYDSF